MLPHVNAFTRMLLTALLLVCAASAPHYAHAQNQPANPNRHEIKMLVLSTISAVNHANLTGNYSVLHALSTPAFQRINPPHRLAGIFLAQRRAGIDITPAVLYDPVLTAPARLTTQGELQLTGYLPTRPIQIDFDLTYSKPRDLKSHRWQLMSLSITPRPYQHTSSGGDASRGAWAQRLSLFISASKRLFQNHQ